MYMFDFQQLKFYLKTARLSPRCFEKVLEIGSKIKANELKLGSSSKCTQSTFKEVLYNWKEEEQYSLLQGMTSGELSLTEVRKKKVYLPRTTINLFSIFSTLYVSGMTRYSS